MEIKNKRILVTGGVGFIGSHLVERLISDKNSVIIVDTTADPRSYLHKRGLTGSVVLLNEDVRDRCLIAKIVTKYHTEYIFHLAAQTLVETAYLNPIETFDVNIRGTLAVLETARLYPFIRGVIIASSDKAYGKLHKKVYKETDPLAGDHPYDASKTAADLISQTYWKTYNTPVTITRFGNVYGEGDLNFSRIVPGILQSIISGIPLQIRSDGSYVRSYIHVRDVVEGYIRLASKSDSLRGEIFNFGSRDILSVLELVRLAQITLKTKIQYTINNSVKNEIPYQALDFSKATKILNWKPKLSLASSLPDMLEYYKKLNKGTII